MNEPLRDPSAATEDTSTRHRILVATAEVLARSGQTKLSLSEVALQAGVSRPTLYRWFASKQELLDAFGIYEREMFDNGISQGDGGPARHRETGRRAAVHRRVPAVVLRCATGRHRTRGRHRAAGTNRAGHAGAPGEAVAGPNGAVKAATAIRVAVSHYIVRSDDDDQFLAQLRHAVGIKQPG